MDRHAKAARTGAGAKRPATTRTRARPIADDRTVEQRLAEALAQQAATSEILRVMAESPSDVQPVFETIAANALRLCDARRTAIFRFDGAMIHIAAVLNLNPEGNEALRNAYPAPPSRGTPTRRAILTGDTVHIADVRADPEYSHHDVAKAADFRSVLSVPMLRDGRPLGTITVYRDVASPFPDRQVELLKTFADQAVIAIENVRLFSELQDRNRDLTIALDQKTATSEILRAISNSPTDVQPVFDTIVEAARDLCGATSAGLFTFDGELIHLAAFVNVSLEYGEALRNFFPSPPSRGTGVTRAIQTCNVVVIPDVLVDREYAHAIGAHALAGDFRSVLAVPLVQEGRAIGAIAVGRREAGPFPDSQIELLRTFADQAVIAIGNVRLFTEVQERNRDLTIALDQQTATSEILRVISSARTDVQPVFDAIVRNAVRLCGTDFGFAGRLDGELLYPLAHHGFPPEALKLVESMFPMRPSPETMLGRAALSKTVNNVPDVLADPLYSQDFAMAGNWRSILAVPMLRDGELIGVMSVGRTVPGEFPAQQVALLQTFADQAVIAIENVRLFTELQARNRDLTEALEQQTATSEILRVIASSPTDTQPVFDLLAQRAGKLCDAEVAVVSRFDGGNTIELAAIQGIVPEGITIVRNLYPMPVDAETITARAIRSAKVVHLGDVLADPSYSIKDFAVAAHFRSGLGVPVVHERKVLGSMFVGRERTGLFTDSQVALLQTFADQAAIAIENVRLFRELEARNTDLTEALEQQTATSEILRVISSSQTDAQPVFETIVRSVRSLCGATFSGVYLFDGETLSLAAAEGLTPDELAAFAVEYPRKIGSDTVTGRAALECRVIQTPDLISDPEYSAAPGSRIGARTVVGVPLMRGNHAIGSIGVWHAEVKPFSETQIALLQTFADQAVIAIENARLFKELQARTKDLTRSVSELKALGDVGQAVSSTLDLETVLSTIVLRANQLSGMDGCAVYEYDEARGEFYLHTADSLPDELVAALRASPIQKGEGALGALAVTGEPTQVRDIVDESVYQSRVKKILIKHDYRSLLAVPLLREDHLLGGLVVNRKSAGEFAPEVIDLLKTFATQSALAIQNARLFREIEVKGRQLEIASQHKSEFLANMSHELRTPLNAIIGFSEVLSERLFGEMNDKQTEYVNDITESGRHLLLLINDILDLSKIEAGRMELDLAEFDVATAIGNTLALVRERAQRRGIALQCAVDENVAIRADERKVKQVLLNLLSNALKFTPEGGAIDVVAVAHDDRIEIAVTDTGVGIAPEDQESVFEEFRQVGSASKKIEGTGLGLAISRKFIELHGGRIWVTSRVGAGSTFTFTLPR